MTQGRPGAHDGARILVVDDEPDVRQIVRLMLAREGYLVQEASDGREAVELLRRHHTEVAAVVLDVMMPRMTGHEALPELRRIVPTLPVVLCSGYDRGEVAEHLHDGQPYTSFLGKPFERAHLVEAVAHAVAAGPHAP